MAERKANERQMQGGAAANCMMLMLLRCIGANSSNASIVVVRVVDEKNV